MVHHIVGHATRHGIHHGVHVHVERLLGLRLPLLHIRTVILPLHVHLVGVSLVLGLGHVVIEVLLLGCAWSHRLVTHHLGLHIVLRILQLVGCSSVLAAILLLHLLVLFI